MAELPVVESWFDTERVGDGVTLLTEPYIDPYMRSNIWHVTGLDRDLVVDTGNGVGDLRSAIEELAGGRPVVAVVTHHHADHMGGLRAFDDRVCHSTEADAVREAREGVAFVREWFPEWLEKEIEASGYEMPETLASAVPQAFQPFAWSTPPAEPTRLVQDGDVIDLGDRSFEVLHVPGHTPGSIGLWEPATGTLFSGDTGYVDDPMGAGDRTAFSESLARLAALPVTIVLPGHNRSFGLEELRSLADGWANGS